MELLQIAFNSLISASLYSLTALGFAVIYRTVKFFHFAHGAVYAAGAYLAYTLTILLGVNPLAAFFLPRCWRAVSASP